MEKSTLKYAMEVVKVQKRYFQDMSEDLGCSRNDVAKQKAYYEGLHDMLEIILTEAFTKPLTEKI